jgi:hypothetical protein
MGKSAATLAIPILWDMNSVNGVMTAPAVGHLVTLESECSNMSCRHGWRMWSTLPVDTGA